MSIDPMVKIFSCKEPAKTVAYGIAGGLGLSLFDHLFTKGFDRLFPKATPDPMPYTKFQRAVSTKGIVRAIPRIALYVLGMPTLEEIAWRAVVRNDQIERASVPESRSACVKRIIINSFLFTLTHFSLRQPLKTNLRLAFPVFVSGILFNLLMEKTGNIWASILAHSIHNSFIIAPLLLRRLPKI